jgi:NOL1/NOP2/fmu family ribosome biogenesis protein
VLDRTDGPVPDADPRAVADAGGLGTAVDDDSRLSTLRDHYGLPDDVWQGLRFHARGDDIHATTAEHAPPARPRPQASGFPLIKRKPAWPKPSTAAAMRLGDRATRNVVDLTRSQRDAYQRRAAFTVEPDQVRACTGRGYVIVRYAGFSLGAAFLKGLDPPEIRSEFPRVWVPHGERTGGDGRT